MSCHGQARCGSARLGRAGVVSSGLLWRVRARQGALWRGRSGRFRFVAVRLVLERLGKAGRACQGDVGHGPLWFGRQRKVGYGKVWRGKPGLALAG